jgi:hypothetical protein
MKINMEKPAGHKKHVVKIESSVWPPLGMLLIIFALATILILNGIYFVSKKSVKPVPPVPQISHVSYWCAGKKTAYPRTARIYPAIKNIAQINEIERDLERDTKCQIVSVYAWQNVDCSDCAPEQEIKKLTKSLITIDGENRALKGQLEKK